MTGTTHDVVNPATTASLVVKVIGISPVAPSDATAAVPTISPPVASVMEFRPSPSAATSSDIMKEQAAQTAAARAQPTPIRLMCAPLKTLSTNMIPAIAIATPESVRLLGRRRVVAHSQPTTRIGAVYSSSSATPTDRCATALK